MTHSTPHFYIPTLAETQIVGRVTPACAAVRGQFWGAENLNALPVLRRHPKLVLVEWVVLRYYDEVCQGLLSLFAKELTKSLGSRKLPLNLDAFVAWAALVECWTITEDNIQFCSLMSGVKIVNDLLEGGTERAAGMAEYLSEKVSQAFAKEALGASEAP